MAAQRTYRLEYQVSMGDGPGLTILEGDCGRWGSLKSINQFDESSRSFFKNHNLLHFRYEPLADMVRG